MAAKPIPPTATDNPLSRCHPRRDNVIVRRAENAKQTSGGILLPDNAFQKQQVGNVIAFGPEVEGLKQGDQVVFSAYAGAEVQQARNAAEFVILRDEDILAVIPEQQ